MFAVSSDMFSFLLISALGLTVFILFSDFQDIYQGMEVSGNSVAHLLQLTCAMGPYLHCNLKFCSYHSLSDH